MVGMDDPVDDISDSGSQNDAARGMATFCLSLPLSLPSTVALLAIGIGGLRGSDPPELVLFPLTLPPDRRQARLAGVDEQRQGGLVGFADYQL